MHRTNLRLAEILVARYGGKVLRMQHNAVVWLHCGVSYLVRCSGRNIRVRQPTLFQVDKLMFLLSDFGVWGVSDFSKANLGPKDAMGFFPLVEW